MTIAYDGSGFVGWQRQNSGVSVQGLLEDALAELDGGAVAVTGAGRTDAGVHALGQAAGVTIARAIDGKTLIGALNARLPETIRILAAVETDPSFHARFHARSKTYRYRIWNSEVLSPFERSSVWHVAAPGLDVEAMQEAAALLVGRHDFAALQGAGSDVATTERRVLASVVSRGPDPALVVYDISGTGFLRHMVRNIAGTLVEVGRGRHPASWVLEVLASRDRAHAGPTAPAEGLFLVRVEYD